MDSLNGDGPSDRRVSPFGHPRLNGYVLLNVAFRSLSRPSSAPSAKAFALCSLFLDLHECFRISFCFCFGLFGGWGTGGIQNEVGGRGGGWGD